MRHRLSRLVEPNQTLVRHDVVSIAATSCSLKWRCETSPRRSKRRSLLFCQDPPTAACVVGDWVTPTPTGREACGTT